MATSTRQPVKKNSKTKAVGGSIRKKYEEEHFIDSQKPVWNYSLFTDEDIENFRNGTLYTGYQKFGAHACTVLDTDGYYFSVWAPNATRVSVVGDFNGWKKQLHPLYVRLDKSGIWEGFIPHVKKGTAYKFAIKGYKGIELLKADPYARYAELRPATSSISWQSGFKWTDGA